MAAEPALPDLAYRRLFEALPDGAFVIDLESARFAWLNEATARLLGTTREALWGAAAPALVADERGEGTGAAPVRRLLERVDGGAFPADTVTTVLEWEGRRLLVGVVRDASARVRVERELQDSRALLSNAFEHSPLLIAVNDVPSGSYVQVNDTFCRVIGLPRDQLLGRTSLELGLMPRQDRERLGAEMLAKGRVSGLEVTVRPHHGGARTVRMWCEFMSGGEDRRIITLAEDVTESVATEAARQELHRRLEKIAARVPGVMFQLRRSADGVLTLPYVSHQLRSLFGVEPGEVAHDAKQLLARFHPDDAPAVSDAVDRSAEQLSLLRIEARLAGGDAAERWVLGSAAPERDADGGVTWNGFIADISERKRAEAALRASQERFQLALRATSDAVWDWDAVRGGWASPNYGSLLGYGPGELSPEGVTWRSLIHPDDLERVNKTIATCMSRGPDRYELEYRMRALSGEWKHVMARGKVISRDASGRATRVVGTHIDVTGRTRGQAEAAQKDRLANLGLLAAGIAHEVNNPLTWVLSNLELVSSSVQRLSHVTTRALEVLRRSGVDVSDLEPPQGSLPELSLTAELALEGTQRLRNLSRALGAFVRVDDAPEELVDVNQALQTAAAMATNELRFRARLVRELQPVPPVRAVVGKLAQVFLNLLVQAARSIPEGRADEHVVTLRSWAEPGAVFVEVTDTGVSMTVEQAEQLLGLAITRDLVRDVRGEVRVTSDEGKGTKVVVRLPADETAATPAKVEAAPAQPTTAAGRARVLVVEDEPAIRRSLQRVLREHEVVLAANGREAKALLEQDQAFDGILCDVAMPELTGPELHAWLRGFSPELAGRFAFLTGGSANAEITAAIEASGAVQLAKPFDTPKLKALVAGWFSRPR